MATSGQKPWPPRAATWPPIGRISWPPTWHPIHGKTYHNSFGQLPDR
jgi:hypothetical protein